MLAREADSPERSAVLIGLNAHETRKHSILLDTALVKRFCMKLLMLQIIKVKRFQGKLHPATSRMAVLTIMIAQEYEDIAIFQI
jgi:hypothetical protein